MYATALLTKPSASRTIGEPFMVPIKSDGNEPELRRGDGVIVVPVARFYDGEGYYAFELRALFGPSVGNGTAIYFASALGKPGHIEIWHTNKLYGTWDSPMSISRIDFERSVLGKVAAHVRITDQSLCPKFSEVMT